MPNHRKQASTTASVPQHRLAQRAAVQSLPLELRGGGARLRPTVSNPADILALQRAVGNQAVQRLLLARAAPSVLPAAVAPPVQRVLYINGNRKTAKHDADPLFDKMEPKLLDLGISAYGAKKYFGEYFKRGQDYDFASFEDFAKVFTNRLDTIFKKETQDRELAKQQGKKAPRRTVHAFKIARPKWPESYKQELGFKSGDNIRHIIRNKTLLSKMQEELETLKPKMKPEELLNYYQKMAGDLGVGPQKHYLTQFKAIYETLYLNLGNLFAGPGGVNQSVGLVSDTVSTYGKDLASKGQSPVDMEDVINKVEGVILSGVRSKKSQSSSAQQFNKGLEEYKTNIVAFLDNLWEYWQDTYGYLSEDGNQVLAQAVDLAPDIDEIGLNLGFDMIDNPHETGSVEQHSILVKLEQKLQGSIQPGNHSLTQLFKEFLQVSGKRKYEPAPSPSLGSVLASQDDPQQFGQQIIPQQLGQQFGQTIPQHIIPQQFGQQTIPQQFGQQNLPQHIIPQQFGQQTIPQQFGQQFGQQNLPQHIIPQQFGQQTFPQQFGQQNIPQQFMGGTLPLLPPLRAVFPGMFPPQQVQLPSIYQLLPHHFQQPLNLGQQNNSMEEN